MSEQESLELSILRMFLLDCGCASETSIDDLLKTIHVKKRSFTGCGFFTTVTVGNIVFDRTKILWGNDVICRLNDSVDIGFLIIPENESLTIEGVTFGSEEFPKKINRFIVSRQGRREQSYCIYSH